MHNQHRFFFAVRPTIQAGTMALDVAQQQIVLHHLLGKPLALSRLHVTLHCSPLYDHVPEDLFQRARAAGGLVEMEPFSVGFDRVGSLGGEKVGGLALTGSGRELKELGYLQRAVASAMQATGIGEFIRERFSPHVSLLYGWQHVAREPVAPIRWQVDELVLIHSYVGLGNYVDLGTWPLKSRQLRLADW